MRRGTYSIVAHDPSTGECGVAVQSHWFSVGSVVTWARAGVGAVATQSVADPAYGPRPLAALQAAEAPYGPRVGSALQADEAPAAALRRLVADEAAGAMRQVAVVDVSGGAAVHTGE